MISSSLSSSSSFQPGLLLLAALIGYLFGAFPTAYFVVRLVAGKNVLDTGSGRTSSTNALRAGGGLAFILTLIGDVSKGAIAMLIVRALMQDGWAETTAGIAAVLGHNLSLLLWLISKRLGGGAGGATFAGGLMLLWPPMALIILPAVPILLYVTGYASVTNTLLVLISLLIFVVRSFLGFAPWWQTVYAVGGSLLIIYTLRPNYQRLRAGTERMVGPRAKRLGKKRAESGTEAQ